MSDEKDLNPDKDPSNAKGRPEDGGWDEPGLEGDFVEIDWEPLQAAIDAMADEGLDVDDNEVMRDHLGALLASLLRRIQSDHDLAGEDVAEAAAEVAALAVQIALGEDEIPDFLPSDD